MFLLLEHDLVAAGCRRADERHGRDLAALATGGQHRHQPALAVADERDAVLVDALLLLEPEQDLPRILGVIGNRHRFGAAATLSDAAFVVAHDGKAGGDEIARELPEDRNTRDRLVAIRRTGSADQDHRRQLRRLRPPAW